MSLLPRSGNPSMARSLRGCVKTRLAVPGPSELSSRVRRRRLITQPGVTRRENEPVAVVSLKGIDK